MTSARDVTADKGGFCYCRIRSRSDLKFWDIGCVISLSGEEKVLSMLNCLRTVITGYVQRTRLAKLYYGIMRSKFTSTSTRRKSFFLEQSKNFECSFYLFMNFGFIFGSKKVLKFIKSSFLPTARIYFRPQPVKSFPYSNCSIFL